MEGDLEPDMAVRDGCHLPSRGKRPDPQACRGDSWDSGPHGEVPSGPRDASSLLQGLELVDTRRGQRGGGGGAGGAGVGGGRGRGGGRGGGGAASADAGDVSECHRQQQQQQQAAGDVGRKKKKSGASQQRFVKDEELLQVHETLRTNGVVSAYTHVMRLAGLAESFVGEASENHGRNVNERNYAMLMRWRESLGRRATYGRLATALLKAGFGATAVMLRELCDGFTWRREEDGEEEGEEGEQ
uniref:Translation initiation factor IF-2-like isoform X1 n=1 Tax=Petromyzon marinus TaxID=7757 RepID=A0AAJ7XIR0_PETMA|nr:translation initiation factor IF-2-like isoform X1 [Petromyzon marinus]